MEESTSVTRRSGRVRCENGQALVVAVLFLVVVIGGAAVAIDVGAWYREQRQAQSAADAAALAGAQALPNNAGQALALAQTYADNNGGSLPTGDVPSCSPLL